VHSFGCTYNLALTNTLRGCECLCLPPCSFAITCPFALLTLPAAFSSLVANHKEDVEIDS